MRRFVDPVLGQLRRPHGALAPATARLLNVVNRPINRWAIRALALNGSEEVLDVGFGGGVGLEMVLRRLTTGRAIGIDISQEMAQGTQNRFTPAAADRLNVLTADVAAIPFVAESFDCAYSVNTIFFWPDVRAGLSEIHRVLRPKGRVVIAAPSAAFWLARWAGLWPPTGVTGLRHAQRLASDVGFRDVRVLDRGVASVLVGRR